MFNNDHRIEGFLIDEQKTAYNSTTGRKNILKEEAVERFVSLSKSRDFKKMTKQETERCLKYTLEFNTRIPMRIDVNKNSLKENKIEINRLETVYTNFNNRNNRKIQIRNRALLAGGLVLAMGTAIYKGPALINKIIENDNIRYEQEQQEALKEFEESQIQQEHQKAIEQLQNDRKAEQIQNEQDAQKLQEQINKFNEQKSQEQQELLEQSREDLIKSYVK